MFERRCLFRNHQIVGIHVTIYRVYILDYSLGCMIRGWGSVRLSLLFIAVGKYIHTLYIYTYMVTIPQGLQYHMFWLYLRSIHTFTYIYICIHKHTLYIIGCSTLRFGSGTILIMYTQKSTYVHLCTHKYTNIDAYIHIYIYLYLHQKIFRVYPCIFPLKDGHLLVSWKNPPRFHRGRKTPRFSSFRFDGVLGLGLPSLSQTSEFNFLEAAGWLFEKGTVIFEGFLEPQKWP